MRRRFRCLILCGLLITLSGTVRGAEPSKTSKPNIVYIMADDLGYAELGCYGQTNIKTPCIDRLADEGMRFTQHYSGSAVCAPSRCVLMTGRHTGHAYIRGNDELPERGDVWGDPKLEGQRPLLPDTVTLGHVLQQAGYVTAAMGKWGLGGPGTTGAPNRQGFDLFYGYLCQREAHNFYPTHLWHNDRKELLEGNVRGNVTGEHYSHDLIVEQALRFIRENRDRPFFLYLPFTIPHLALQVPDDSLAEYDGAFPEKPYDGKRGYQPHPTPRAAYAAMVSRMDRDVGQIVDLLKELGLSENTLVIFTSDNGPTIKVGGADSDFFQSAGPLRGLKMSLYEGGIRVPMIARWPGKVQPGTQTDHLSAFWDVLPTLAEVAGAKSPDEIDGVSFAPTLLGGPNQTQHEYLYWEYGRMQAVRLGKWKAVRPNAKKNPDAPVQLFDLQTDIGETTDLAAENPDIALKTQQIMRDARTDSPFAKWNFRK